MTVKNFIGRMTLTLAPILIGAAAFWLALGYYPAAFVAVVLVVACMELRVRAGWRMPRQLDFVVHVAAGALLLALLALLSWHPALAGVPAFAGLLLILVAVGGGALLLRQYR